MWKIGPECAAQQAKKVMPSTRNCGERSAWPTLMPGSSAAGEGMLPSDAATAAGGWRTRRTAGKRSTQAMTPMSNMAVRQS